MSGSLCLLAGLSLWAADPAVSEVRINSVVVTLIDQIDVPALEAGMLVSLDVSEGQVVEEGQLVGRIDDRDVRLLQARAETELAQAQELAANDIKIRFARKSAEVAKAELQRALDSLERLPKSVSKTELDRLQLIADRTELEIEQAGEDLSLVAKSVALKQHDLDRAKFQVERRRITSPLTGMVVQWKRRRGEWVEPGTPVVRMIRLNQLRAEGFAPATALPLLHVGRATTLKVESPGSAAQTFTGELVYVSPEIDPVNGQVRFWAEIDNPQLKLRPGQSGTLTVHTHRREATAKVDP
jgi:multidrug efflux pump subunit AcrA (membrane-fusion protein)